MIRLLVGSVLLLSSATVDAGSDDYSPRYEACLEKSEGATYKMLDCMTDEHDRQDARLNVAYKKLAAEQSPSRKQALLAIQRLWIKYRDANCTFYDNFDGGSAGRIVASSCLLRMTSERAAELENLAE